jgi:signal transduction histidine kinase
MSARTLVGRMAALQIAVLLTALAAVLALTFVLMTWMLQRGWDEALRTAIVAPAQELRRRPGRVSDPDWLEDLADRRAAGERVELRALDGALLGAVGAGPPLGAPRDGDGCWNDAGWRVCQTTASRVRVLAGHPRAGGLEARRRAVSVVAVVALFVAAIASLLARTLAARALAPLSEMARRIAGIRPGVETGVGMSPPFVELRALVDSFDQLLVRVDEALGRERRFAAEASHELRTPLTVLRGEVELCARGAGQPEQALRAIDQLSGLVDALLWLSRAHAPLDRASMMVVNLADLAREQALAVAALCEGRRVAVSAPEEVLVAGEETLLRRAVANLIDNACKYGARGEPVEVEVTAGETAAVVSVADRGQGIAPGAAALIFEPFFRGGRERAATPGFGLGLPLARAIARVHGGDVVLAPAPEGQTRFELSIPWRPSGEGRPRSPSG